MYRFSRGSLRRTFVGARGAGMLLSSGESGDCGGNEGEGTQEQYQCL